MHDELKARLHAAGQAHLIARLPEIAAQVEGYTGADWARWRAAVTAGRARAETELAPMPCEPALPADAAALQATGEALIRAGGVAAFVGCEQDGGIVLSLGR